MAPLSAPGDVSASLVCSGNTLSQDTDFTAPQVMLPYTGSRHRCVSVLSRRGHDPFIAHDGSLQASEDTLRARELWEGSYRRSDESSAPRHLLTHMWLLLSAAQG